MARNAGFRDAKCTGESRRRERFRDVSQWFQNNITKIIPAIVTLKERDGGGGAVPERSEDSRINSASVIYFRNNNTERI